MYTIVQKRVKKVFFSSELKSLVLETIVQNRVKGIFYFVLQN